MKRLITLCLAAATLSAGAQQADDSVFDDRWYAGLTGGLARPGSDRLTESAVPYFGTSFGRFLSPDFSLELQLDAYRAEFKREELVGELANPVLDQDLELYGLGLVGRYHLGDAGDRHRLYGLAGLGIQEHQSYLDDGRDMYASFGVGLRSELSRNWSLRAQLEGRYDNDRQTFDRDHGFVDMIASVGLTFAFGEPPKPPAPQPAAETARPAPPPPPPEPEPEPEVMFDFDATVLFAFDSAALRPEAEAELDRAADVLAPRDDIVVIEVAGHTDSIGTEAYNQDLSERRAQSVADYLAERGVDRDRMQVVGYGETQPRVPNDSPENRQKNRRVVISTLQDD
jgi:OOP family OmpA-OmpF porin